MKKFSFDSSDYYVVIGLGLTGFSCLRYLVEQGLQVAVTDSRENPPCLAEAKQKFPQVPIVTGKFSAELIREAHEIVVSPGVALDHPLLIEAQKNGIPVIGDVELFARVVKAPIVAITGSNGKSTVTTLVGLMAKQAGLNVKVGGNLGTPVLDFLVEAEPDCYVLELSSFQLDTTYSLEAEAAVVLNISPDHLDRYPTLEAYLHSKQRIYHGCKRAVINLDELITWQDVPFVNAPFGFSLDSTPSASLKLKQCFTLIEENQKFYLAVNKEKLLAVDDIKIKGKHNWQNALAALALGTVLNLPQEAMLSVLKDFSGLPHRCEWVTNINGVEWFNDSKGTNVGATQSALKGLGELLLGKKLILIAGGQGKGADFSILNPELQHYVKQVILLGEDAALLATTWQAVVPCVRVESLQAAVEKAFSLAIPGDTVLLSPACASLDMFKNYEDRGAQFIAFVKQLA